MSVQHAHNLMAGGVVLAGLFVWSAVLVWLAGKER